jgi:hypothetical protein
MEITFVLSYPPTVYKPETYTSALVKKSAFMQGQKVRIRAKVTDNDGANDIDKVVIDIVDPNNNLVIDDDEMVNISSVENGYIYEYNYTLASNAPYGVWNIIVTAYDKSVSKNNNSVNIAVLPITLSVKIVLNNTNANVYIPGVGEKNASNLGEEEYDISNLTHYYIASYENNKLSGLVFSHQHFVSIFTNNTTSDYTMGINQWLTNSRVFLVFSRGDWKAIDNRMDLIEKGKFLTNIAPSFSFGLGTKSKIKVALEYDNIAILNDTSLGKGYYKLIFGNEGAVGDKVGISVKRI